MRGTDPAPADVVEQIDRLEAAVAALESEVRELARRKAAGERPFDGGGRR